MVVEILLCTDNTSNPVTSCNFHANRDPPIESVYTKVYFVAFEIPRSDRIATPAKRFSEEFAMNDRLLSIFVLQLLPIILQFDFKCHKDTIILRFDMHNNNVVQIIFFYTQYNY